MKRLFEIASRSEQETQALGESVGRLCRGGETIALYGDLGGGKTVFARGVAAGAGIEDLGDVRSPTFTIINEYDGPLAVAHCDLYRLRSAEEAREAGLESALAAGGVCLIEWADRAEQLLPEDRLEIRFEFEADDPNSRKISVAAAGRRHESIAAALQQGPGLKNN